MKKRIPIKYSIERVVLSDVLPYETPVTFSNRFFYNYLIKRRKQKYAAKMDGFSEVEKILFNTDDVTNPFRFKISHKENDFRELNIIHPYNQVKVMNFYDDFKSLILYHCSSSPFSIRKPNSIAKFTYFNDILHSKNNDGDLKNSQIEQDENEYENLKSFFTYQKYSNIHKFFESYSFHRCEKKYNQLLRTDISKCFDSIYTHTISWALYNKEIVKGNILDSEDTFPGKFDKLMQKLNANETNGIVIGPEFSRIFSELILQVIDKDVHSRLRKKDEKGNSLIHKVNYEIFRYVDDYFIFFNEDTEKERIIKEFKLSLKEYKMYLSESKNILYAKPIITEISIAKQKICDLFNEHLLLKEKTEDEGSTSHTLYFSSNSVITRFKTIIKESKIDYKDIMNYALAVLDKKTAKLIKKFKTLDEESNSRKTEKQFEKGFLEILDVAFFLYSVSPRVNSTIKICLILDKVICFLKKNKTNDYMEPFSYDGKHTIFKKISDEVNQILNKNKTKTETPIETLYLLIALSQLGRDYRINNNLLCDYLNIQKIDDEFKINNSLNYFTITVILFFIKDITIYSDLKRTLKCHILDRFGKINLKNWNSDTEIVLLLLDLMSCPFLNESVNKHLKDKIVNAKIKHSPSLKRYIKEAKDIKYSFKKKILNLLEIKSNQIPLIEFEKFWFTKWTEFDFGLELQAKRSQEVY